MIDFIRLQYKDKSTIEPFVSDSRNFEQLITSLEYHSGEVLYPLKVNIHNVEVTVNEKSAYVKNSLHKFHNVLHGLGNQNHNDFTYGNLIDVIDCLKCNLIDLNDADITQLEFGLNIEVPKSAEVLIRENIFFHKYKAYNHNKKFKGKGEYKQYDYSNYYIKIYDKAKQYNRFNNILRFEIKFINKKEFNALGVKHIDDLKSKENLERLFNYLLKRFDEMLIVDDLSVDKVPNNDYKKLELYLSSNFWEKLSDRKLRNSKAKHKKEFEDLLSKYNLLRTKSHLRNLLIQKFQLLINQ